MSDDDKDRIVNLNAVRRDKARAERDAERAARRAARPPSEGVSTGLYWGLIALLVFALAGGYTLFAAL